MCWQRGWARASRSWDLAQAQNDVVFLLSVRTWFCQGQSPDPDLLCLIYLFMSDCRQYPDLLSHDCMGVIAPLITIQVNRSYHGYQLDPNTGIYTAVYQL